MIEWGSENPLFLNLPGPRYGEPFGRVNPNMAPNHPPKPNFAQNPRLPRPSALTCACACAIEVENIRADPKFQAQDGERG